MTKSSAIDRRRVASGRGTCAQQALRISAILLALLVLCWGDPVRAQQSTGRLERARSLRRLTQNKVYRDRVQPHWLPGNTQFWYEAKTGADTHEYILVDAEQGRREPAFDHARLAQALVGAGFKEAKADRLSLEDLQIKPAEHALEFSAGGKSWRYDLEHFTLQEQPAAKTDRAVLAPLAERPRASLRTGPETRLNFVNRTTSEVELFWLDSDAQRRSYGKLRAGEEREQHTYTGHVWLVADAQGRTLAVFQAEEQAGTAEIRDGERRGAPAREGTRRRPAPRDTSPDGHWRVSIRDFNLVLHPTQDGTAVALSSDGKSDDAYSERVYWSPDSRKLVALRTRKGDDRKVYLIESSPRDQLQPKLQSYDYLKPGDRIPLAKPQLFDVETRRHITVNDELFSNPWSISDLRWAADSSRFTFLYNQRGHQVLRVIEVAADTGRARVLIEEHSQTFIDYAGKLFYEPLEESGEIVWMSERDGWNHLYLCNARTGRVDNQITAGPWVVRGVDRVDRVQRQIWFRASGIRPGQDPYYIHYCRVNFDGTGLVVLTAGDGTHSVQFSPDRRYFIDTYSRVDLPPVNELRRSQDGRLVSALERADWGALLQTGWRAPEPFVAKGRDGETDIYGVINRPTDFDPSKRYPVIENIYAGPQDSFVPKAFSAPNRMQELAELGFIVVQIDGMGTSNRSKKFHDVCWKNLGDAGFPDRILWLQAAAAKYPSLDLSRVGIYGTSAGGQSALDGLLTHGDFYKVGVADCGCHDNRMDKIWWNELWMGWPVGPEYAAQSNVTLAHQLRGKLLLMVGELDRNVDPASTMQVVHALIKADKDFDLLVVPGAGHGVAGTPYGQRRLREFFVHNLLGVSGAPWAP